VVIASSAAVYAPTTGALAENASPVEAIDAYSLSKLTNERQGGIWHRRTGKPVRIARIFNTVAFDDPNGHLFPDLIDQFRACTGPRLAVALGNTAPRRDYVDADDVAQALLALAADAARGGCDVFNICSGAEHSVAEVAHALARCFGIEVDIRMDDARRRANDRLSLLGAPEKAAEQLGWRARYSLAQIAARACALTRQDDASMAGRSPERAN